MIHFSARRAQIVSAAGIRVAHRRILRVGSTRSALPHSAVDWQTHWSDRPLAIPHGRRSARRLTGITPRYPPGVPLSGVRDGAAHGARLHVEESFCCLHAGGHLLSATSCTGRTVNHRRRHSRAFPASFPVSYTHLTLPTILRV